MTTASGVQQIDAQIAGKGKPIQFNVINLLNAARHILTMILQMMILISVQVQAPCNNVKPEEIIIFSVMSPRHV